MKKLTDDKICEALENDTYFEAKDLKEMKKQPNVQELYLKLNKYEKLEAELGCSLEVLEPNQKVEFIKDNEIVCADIMGVNIQTKKIMIGSAWSFKELPLNQYKKTWWLKKDKSE